MYKEQEKWKIYLKHQQKIYNQIVRKKYKDCIIALIDTAIRNPKKKVDIVDGYEEMLQLFA